VVLAKSVLRWRCEARGTTIGGQTQILWKESSMSLRLVITLSAAPGKGAEFAEAFRGRCLEVMTEPGCEQFEVFRSALDPDKLVLLEHWKDEAALTAHMEVNKTRAPLPEGLSGGMSQREDYVFSRTR